MNFIKAVAFNTYREAVRNKLLYIVLLFAALILLTGNFLTDISLNQDKRIMWDLGIGFLRIFAVIITVFSGLNLVFKEIDRKTVYLILSKPAPRSHFVIGKLLGLLAAVYLVLTLMFLIFLLETFIIKIPFDIALFKAAALIYAEVFIILSLAILFSSLTTPFLSGMFTIGIFAIGNLLPDFRRMLEIKYEATPIRYALEQITQIFPHLYLFSPNGHEYKGTYISLTADFISWNYVAWALFYALLYGIIMTFAASFIFTKRDLT